MKTFEVAVTGTWTISQRLLVEAENEDAAKIKAQESYMEQYMTDEMSLEEPPDCEVAQVCSDCGEGLETPESKEVGLCVPCEIEEYDDPGEGTGA